jgi:hypothetical protein
MSPEERGALIDRYTNGARALREAYEASPAEMRTWRPAPNEWSVHEIICHCADSEMGGALRFRMLVAEPDPRLIGYDQDAWTRIFDYHNRSTDLAFAVIEAVRSWTAPLLSLVTDEQWGNVGHHSESGAYSMTDWLESYGNHLDGHVQQINANIEAWQKRS